MFMRVSKWGHSVAIRLSTAVVEALGVKEGDEVEISITGKREFNRISGGEPEGARHYSPSGSASSRQLQV